MLGFMIGQLGYGPLSDHYGRRPVLMSGLGLYIAATILCCFSWNAESLVFFRFLQAVGGGAGTVLSRAIIRDRYSGDVMARMMSIMLSVVLFAPMIAPFIGGYLLVWLGWRAVFWTLTLCGLLALGVTLLGIRESLVTENRAAIDPRSLLVAYANVLRHRRAVGYVLSGGFSFGTLFAFLSSAAFVFIDYYGLKPTQLGYVFIVNVLGVQAGGLINSRLVLTRGLHRMMGIAVMMLVCGSAALFGLIIFDIGGLWGAVFGIMLFTIPLNMINANAAAGTLEYFPHQAGTASAVIGAVRYGMGALSGVCVGLLHDGTPLPMATVILGCAVLSALSLFVIVQRRP